jgi:DNA-binding NtrC family response regulator
MANEESAQRHEATAHALPASSLPLHVVVATEHEELTWSVLNAFGSLPEVRVTGCRSMAQTRYVCALDPPQVVIVDMDILAHDALGLVTLANTGREHTHIVALSEHPVFEVGARFGRARLTFIQKPVSPEDLVLLLRVRLDDDPSLPSHVC